MLVIELTRSLYSLVTDIFVNIYQRESNESVSGASSLIHYSGCCDQLLDSLSGGVTTESLILGFPC